MEVNLLSFLIGSHILKRQSNVNTVTASHEVHERQTHCELTSSCEIRHQHLQMLAEQISRITYSSQAIISKVNECTRRKELRSTREMSQSSCLKPIYRHEELINRLTKMTSSVICESTWEMSLQTHVPLKSRQPANETTQVLCASVVSRPRKHWTHITLTNTCKRSSAWGHNIATWMTSGEDRSWWASLLLT